MKDGERAGPFKVFQIVEMLRSEQVRDTDLAWCSAVDHWMPLKDIPPLEGHVKIAVEEVSSGEVDVDAVVERTARKTLATDSARPWMRFLARTFDTYIIYSVVAYVVVRLGFATPGVFLESADMLTAIGIWLIATYLWVFLEAGFLATVGATPGKLLFGIRILTEEGEKLTYRQALRRSLTVWIRGYGLGVPFLREVMCLMSFIAFLQEGTTPWDEKGGLTVTHGAITRKRWLLLIVAMLSMFAGRHALAYRIDPDFREMIDKGWQEFQNKWNNDEETAPNRGEDMVI